MIELLLMAAATLAGPALLVAQGVAGIVVWFRAQRHASTVREIEQAGMVFAAAAEVRR